VSVAADARWHIPRLRVAVFVTDSTASRQLVQAREAERVRLRAIARCLRYVSRFNCNNSDSSTASISVIVSFLQ